MTNRRTSSEANLDDDPDDYENPHLRNKRLKTTSRNKSRLFAITIPFTTISKTVSFNFFEKFCEKIVITEEKHYNGEVHHHIFISTIKKFLINDVKKLVCIIYDIEFKNKNRNDCLYNTGEVYVSTVKNQYKYIAYITKNDIEPCFKGVTTETFSFVYRAYEWVKNTPNYEIGKFVLNHANCYKLLKEFHHQETTKNKSSQLANPKIFIHNESLGSPCCPNMIHPWAEEIVNWWNDWIQNGPSRKKKQLYVYGHSNVGKTSFIHYLLYTCINYDWNIPGTDNYNEYQYENQIFSPTSKDLKFAFMKFNKNLHKVCLIDEFDINNFDSSDFKLLLAGELLQSCVKFNDPLQHRIHIPTIIISNLDPPSEYTNPRFQGIQERLKIVHADINLY